MTAGGRRRYRLVPLAGEGQFQRINWSIAEGRGFDRIRVESAGGSSTPPCGTRLMAGQGGPQIKCDGLFGSPEKHLQHMERGGLCNDVGSKISRVTALRNWQRHP